MTRSIQILCAVLAMTLAGCDGAGSDPGTRPGALQLNDTVTRTFPSSGKSDALTFTASRALLVHVDVQQLVESAPGVSISWTFVDAESGTALVAGTGQQPQGALGPDVGDPAINWLRIPAPGSYQLIVSPRPSATNAQPYIGTYRARLVGSDPAPEHATKYLAPGDSASESIDASGDVDEFILTGLNGQSALVAVLTTRTGRASDTLALEGPSSVLLPGPTVLALSPADDNAGRATINLAAAGESLHVRVRARSGATTGSYLLAWRRVNPAPERAEKALIVGDTIQEAIDFPGDVDVFSVIGDPGKQYVVAVQPTSGRATDRLRFVVTRPGVDRLLDVVLPGNTATLLGQLSARFAGGTETTITIAGAEDGRSQGSYRIAVLPIDTRQE